MESDPVPSLFRCSKCNTNKPFGDFPPSKARNTGQWCRACLRINQRLIKGLTATERTTSCAHCGKSFDTTYTKAMYCSRDCKVAARRLMLIAETAESKPERSCLWCGGAMPKTMRSDARFCSRDCNGMGHKQIRNVRRRSGVKSPAVTLISIATRDKFRCGICGGKVDMTLKHPDPQCASLDHVVPLAHGGTHDAANLQLSHLRCNISKGVGGGTDQLRLI